MFSNLRKIIEGDARFLKIYKGGVEKKSLGTTGLDQKHFLDVPKLTVGSCINSELIGVC